MTLYPKCHSSNIETFVDVKGQVLPCCWMGGPNMEHSHVQTRWDANSMRDPSKPENELYRKLLPKLTLDNGTIDDIIASPQWRALLMLVGDSSTTKPICEKMCSNADGEVVSFTREKKKAFTRGDILHLELSTRCTLACPRCMRTMRPEFFDVQDMSLDHLEKAISSHRFKALSLSGNFGDPIYHRQFHDAVGIMNNYEKGITLTTNGSRRSANWWREAVARLEDNICPRVRFSVDGLEDTNGIYRVNSKWDDIMDAMEIVAGSPKIIGQWKFIVFKHNQHQIEEARSLARDIGIGFDVVYSSRFGKAYSRGNADPLKPDDKYLARALSDKK